MIVTMEKRNYIKPHMEVVPFSANRNLLLVVSGTETDTQMAPGFDSPEDDIILSNLFL